MIDFRTVLNSEGEFLSVHAAAKLAAEGEESCCTQQGKRCRDSWDSWDRLHIGPTNGPVIVVADEISISIAADTLLDKGGRTVVKGGRIEIGIVGNE